MKKNLVIFVSDALRYDFLPHSIAENGEVITTLAPSLATPISFASLATAKSPLNHNVSNFVDPLDSSLPTIFDFFPNVCFYDHPNSAVSNYIFKRIPAGIELTEIKEPFIWMERMMDTHSPYGKMGHGGKLPSKWKKFGWGRGRGGDYFEIVRKYGSLLEEYKKGVKRVEEHFWRHISELKQRNILEDTLIVFTSDHGELLGEKRFFRRRYGHTFPACIELVKIPTVFFDISLKEDFMRTIDIVPTCLDILNKLPKDEKFDGVSIRKEGPDRGISLLNSPYMKYLSKWQYEEGQLHLKNRFKISMQTLLIEVVYQLAKLLDFSQGFFF